MQISIIVPYFKAGRFAVQLAGALAQQVYTDFEVILVDDGGGIEFDDVYSQFESHGLISRTTFVSTLAAGSGPANARNLGLLVANSKYIAFLDADDTWDPDYLRQMSSLMVEKDFSVVVCEVTYKNNGEQTRAMLPESVRRCDLLQTNLLHPPAVLVNRSHFPHFEFPKCGHEDYALWLSVLDNDMVVPCLHKPLVHINRVTDSVSSNFFRSAGWHWKILKAFSGKTLPTRMMLFFLYGINAVIKRKVAIYRPVLLPKFIVDLLR